MPFPQGSLRMRRYVYQGTACAYSLREMDGASYHAASVDDCLCHTFVEIINGDTFVFTLGHCALL